MIDSDPQGADARAEADASDWFARMRGPEAARWEEAFAAWHSDPEHARAYGEIAAIWALTGMMSSEAVRERAKTATSGQGWLVWRWVLAAATLAGVLAAGLLVIGLYRPPEARQEVYAATGNDRRLVQLADGSRITLDPGSEVTADFSGAERRVRLRAGRARFAVAHYKAHPFVVLAQDRAIVARGTVFDVTLEEEPTKGGQGSVGTVSVTLIEGAVDLERRNGRTAPRHLARLRPGETASFTAGGELPRIARSGDPVRTASMLSGEGMLLADVLVAANRQSASKIALGDPDLGRLRVSGGIPLQEPGRLVSVLSAALELEAVTGRDGRILLVRTARTPAPD